MMKLHRTAFLTLFVALATITLSSTAVAQQSSGASASNAPGLAPILNYISSGWGTLTRSMTSCDSLVDSKIRAAPVLYLPADFPVPAAVQKLHSECGVQIEHLPAAIHGPGSIDTRAFHPHGLLYLENKYVVPGGRFNEMYGWDSYFIIRGLVRDGRVDLARGMIDNFFFEIEHYGSVLNANRTYFFSRAQPPFLSSMVMAVSGAQQQAGHEDRAWIEKAYNYLSRDYDLWTHEPHLAGNTGLSRYYDFGHGPPAEGLQDESGFYRKVAEYFILHPEHAAGMLVEKAADAKTSDSKSPVLGASYSVQVCDQPTTMARPECEPARSVSLSEDYYKGDRAMRESGFDISFRFGPYSAATHHYAPVCLNSLLYKTERDMEQISLHLGRKADTALWKKRAEQRREAMQKYFWNEKAGLFFDYDFEHSQQSSYRYATTFYPLWSGIATPEQAKALARNLKIFERPGGLAMSPEETGVQWDYPYAWAPLQLLTVEGLRRYGLSGDANRLSYEFLSNVAENFRRDGTIREKYNAVTRSSEIRVGAGYQANVIGFGWTNGVFLELLHQLPESSVEHLAKEQDVAATKCVGAALSTGTSEPPECASSHAHSSRRKGHSQVGPPPEQSGTAPFSDDKNWQVALRVTFATPLSLGY